MAYKNARDVLPGELVAEIQKYIDGDLIYIPSKSAKTEWGKRSGARQKYAERNDEIRREYMARTSVEELASRYFLSPESIKKIVYGDSSQKGRKKA